MNDGIEATAGKEINVGVKDAVIQTSSKPTCNFLGLSNKSIDELKQNRPSVSSLKTYLLYWE